MSTIKKWSAKAVVTKVEDGKVEYDVGDLFQAIDDVEGLCFIPELGEELIYTVTLESFTTSDKKFRQ